MIQAFILVIEILSGTRIPVDHGALIASVGLGGYVR